MNVRLALSSRLFFGSVTLAGVIACFTGAIVIAAEQRSESDLPPVDSADHSPPPYSRWIRPETGQFEAYTWDDRPISDAEKRAQPWYDPRWKPFSDCMVAEGYDVRADPTKPFSQQDLDEVVDRANAELPDVSANKQIGSSTGDLSGIAGAFMQCGDRWLALTRDQWLSEGIEKLEPGELPEP